MQINLSHGEMFQKIFEGGLPEKTIKRARDLLGQLGWVELVVELNWV